MKKKRVAVPQKKQQTASVNKKTSKSGLKKRKRQKELLALKRKRAKQKKLLFELLITLVVTTLLVVLISVFLLAFPKVEGYSMVPTLNDQERLIVYKPAKIERFDLIYIKNKLGETSIRRVIGLPGEEIQYKGNELYINNELKAERFITRNEEQSEEPAVADFKLKDILGVSNVPKSQYFVLGDNREYATDSREYGFIETKDIVGVVKIRFFPLHGMRQF
ncbi:signal peptidase I [Enterococcus crotali]|uniref:signal peptidase I n=1 Tax=Enterococcus crotali TaxID=1453587 RepID=UPI00046F4804|nr:signal peptidase I [Enterococcus crotali]OTP50621.1 signal peptidase I [Enterococcus termitis]